MAKKGRGRPKKSLFSKILKIVKNYLCDGTKKPKISFEIKIFGDVPMYVRTDVRVEWRQYPIRSKLCGVKMENFLEKMKNSKIYFREFLSPMVLHIWSKFHVPSLIFEGEDLFWVSLRRVFVKNGLFAIFSKIFKISTHETYWNM